MGVFQGFQGFQGRPISISRFSGSSGSAGHPVYTLFIYTFLYKQLHFELSLELLSAIFKFARNRRLPPYGKVGFLQSEFFHLAKENLENIA